MRIESLGSAPEGAFSIGHKIRHFLILLAALCAFAAWLLPNHYPPWTSFHNEAAAFASLAFTSVAWIWGRGNASVPKPVMFGLAMLGIVWAHWATGLVPYFGDALVATLYISGFSLSFLIGSTLAERAGKQLLILLAVTTVCAALVSIFVALHQWVWSEEALGIFAANRGPDDRPFGNLAQPNHLATLLLITTVLMVGLWLFGWLQTGGTFAMLACLAFGLIVTESRSGLLGAALVGAALLWKRGELNERRLLGLVIAWWVTIGLLYVAWVPLNEALHLQPSRVQSLTNDSGRLLLWKQIWTGIEASPWTGYGWRQTMAAHKIGAVAFPGPIYTEYAHNFVLDVIAWTGIPLGVFIVGVCGWWLVTVSSRLRGRVQVILFVAVIPILAHSMTEFPFAYAYFLFPLGGLLGGVWALQRRAETHKAEAPVRWWPASVIYVATFIAVCVATGFEYLEVEEDYRILRFEWRNVGARPVDYQPPQLNILTQFSEVAFAGNFEPYARMTPSELERVRVASISFGWATLHLKYAVALGLNDRTEEAGTALIHLRSIYGPHAWTQARALFIAAQEIYPALRSVDVPR